jgi:hypothetical protein
MFIVFAMVVGPIIWHWRNPNKGEGILEAKQLHFAAVTLTGLGLLFALSMAMYYWGGDKSTAPQQIFDACKTIIPPIVTLILGYYFGSKSGGEASRVSSDVKNKGNGVLPEPEKYIKESAAQSQSDVKPSKG